MPTKKILTTVVKMSRWARGGKKGAPCLRNKAGNMCCLGFRAKVGGAKNDDIEFVYDPQGVCGKYEFFSGKFVNIAGGNTMLCEEMIKTNDYIHLTDKKRMATLKKLFKKAGERIVFKP